MARLPECHAPLIITLDADRGEKDVGSKVASERLRAGRKRARKLRQRMTARYSSVGPASVGPASVGPASVGPAKMHCSVHCVHVHVGGGSRRGSGRMALQCSLSTGSGEPSQGWPRDCVQSVFCVFVCVGCSAV